MAAPVANPPGHLTLVAGTQAVPMRLALRVIGHGRIPPGLQAGAVVDVSLISSALVNAAGQVCAIATTERALPAQPEPANQELPDA